MSDQVVQPSVDEAVAAPPVGDQSTEQAQKAFSTSVVISGTRCLLSYVILPFVTPFLGFLSGIGPVLGIVIALVAIVANVFSIRRFMASGHRWRWVMASINVSMIVLVSVLLVLDVRALVT